MSSRTISQKPSSGLLGNVKCDGSYIAPWGKEVVCHVLTDYGDPPLYGIIPGVTGADLSAEATEWMNEKSQASKGKLRKQREVDKVEKRFVFMGSRKEHQSAIYSRCEERASEWPSKVLEHVHFGRDNAQSAKEIADALRCKPAHLKLPPWPEKWSVLEKGDAPLEYAGVQIWRSGRGYYRKPEGEQEIL